MTAITGRIGITKRPGELGIHSMDTFNLVVPDLKQAEEFYKPFGLDVREEGDTLGLYTFGSAHRWATLSEGSRKKLNFLSFGVFEEDFEPIKAGPSSWGSSCWMRRAGSIRTASGSTTRSAC